MKPGLHIPSATRKGGAACPGATPIEAVEAAEAAGFDTVVLDAVTFLVGAVLHLGAMVPLSFVILAEPVIIPATIVAGLAGLGLAVAAYAPFARSPWSWPAALGARAFALAGVLLGMTALAAAAGPRTELNDIYHRVMLVVLLTPAAKAVLGRGDGASSRG